MTQIDQKMTLLIAGGISQALIMMPVLFHLSVYKLEGEILRTLSKCTIGSWGECLLCWRAQLPFRGNSAGWMNGLAGISSSSAQVSPTSSPQAEMTP